MSKHIATRGAQYPLVAEFTFLFSDTMVDINGVEKDFKTVGTAVFDVINLPPNAIVTAGEIVTETAVTGSTAYNITMGSPYFSAGTVDRLAAGKTTLVTTGYVGLGEQIRLTVAPTVADATAGKVTLRISYIVRNRVNETQTH